MNTDRSGKNLLVAYLNDALIDLEKAIAYRQADVICEGEGPDDTEESWDTGCTDCRERARRELDAFRAIKVTLLGTLTAVEAILGLEHEPTGLSEAELDQCDPDLREGCEEVWESVIAGVPYSRFAPLGRLSEVSWEIGEALRDARKQQADPDYIRGMEHMTSTIEKQLGWRIYNHYESTLE